MRIFSLILGLYFGLNIYVGVRAPFFFRLALSPLAAVVYGLCYALLFLSWFIAVWTSVGALGGVLRVVGGYWMVASIYLFGGFLLADILLLIGKLPVFASLVERLPPHARTLAGIFVILCAFSVTAYGAVHARSVKTVTYRIEPVNPSPAGELRIALISDLHLGTWVDAVWLDGIVDRINGLQPDIVCITGDIFDNNLESIHDLERYAEVFRQIRAPHGVYACLGNHDVERASFRRQDGEGAADESWRPGQPGRIRQFLTESNIVLLEDEMVLVDDRFYIAGRPDVSPIGVRGHSRLAVHELVANRDTGLPLILIEHQPWDIPVAAAAGVDLLLSGHTHKGQVFPGNLVTRRMYLVDYGYHQEQDTHIVVTSGAGVWGPPVRVGTNSEVVIIDYKW